MIKQREPARFTLLIAMVAGCLLLQIGDAGAVLAQSLDQPIADEAAVTSVMNDTPDQQVASSAPSGLDLWSLIFRGGMFMIPIGLMSVLVVTLAVERLLSLRSAKVIPRKLVRETRSLAIETEKFHPSIAFQVCDKYPSAASRVIKAMLLRTGQPIGEIERAATETAQREADRYAAPIRWLNLAAAATPLMGLLGTVWGMIVAFHESTTLSADRSRSEQLSEGIYTALVTTLAGLVVAIPAAMLAQYLENRLTKLFGRVEQLAFDIAPGLTRFVGRRRLERDGSMHPMHLVDVSGGKDKPPSRDVTPPPVSGSKTDGETKSAATPRSRSGRDGLPTR